MTRLPDAGAHNWVDRLAPPALRPWLKLGRFDRPVGIWLLWLPCLHGLALAAIVNAHISWSRMAAMALVFGIGACLMRAAGCAYNDIIDRDIDAKVARTASRPVASGAISVRAAAAFVAGCALISLLILLSLNRTAVLLGVGSLALVAAYPFMKRITWWPQAWLGLTFNWGALMGFAAAFTPLAFLSALEPGGRLDLSVWLLYAALVFWTLGYDTLYAQQDMEDDALIGVKSSALRLGAHARTGVGLFYGIMLALLVAAGVVAGAGGAYFGGLVLVAGHLSAQVARMKSDSPARALGLFRSNRETGLLLLLALLLGQWGL